MKQKYRIGVDVVIEGQWHQIVGGYEDGMIMVVDQDGGEREVSVDMVDHIY